MSHAIYILRHAETTLNKEGRYQGANIDSPLTQKGEEQAHKMASFFKNRNVKHIYCSSLGRSERTAQIIAQDLGLEPIACDFLMEMDFGKLSGKLKEETLANYSDFFEQRTKNKARTPYPGGESYADVEKRIREPIRTIVDNAHGPIVIVGHESVNRIVRGVIEKRPLDEVVHLRQGNNQIIEYVPRKNCEFSYNIQS